MHSITQTDLRPVSETMVLILENEKNVWFDPFFSDEFFVFEMKKRMFRLTFLFEIGVPYETNR